MPRRALCWPHRRLALLGTAVLTSCAARSGRSTVEICGVEHSVDVRSLSCRAESGTDDPVALPEPGDIGQLRVEDQKPLARMRSIETLALSAALLPDVEVLTRLKKLEHLHLDVRSSFDTRLDALGELTGLQSLVLDLEHAGRPSLPSLEALTSLRELKVSNTEPLDLSVLQGLATLERLHIDQPSCDLRPLASLPALTKLSLERLCGDLDFSALARVEDLSLGSRVKVDEALISELARLPALRRLNLEGRAPSASLASLVELRGLESLSVRTVHSPEVDLDWLTTMSGLRALRVELEPPRDSAAVPPKLAFPSLANLGRLESLSLEARKSGLSDLTWLAGLPNLRELRLKVFGTRLSTLAPLGSLHRLEQLELDVRGTSVHTLDALGELSDLTRLELWLSEVSATELAVLRALPQLTHLGLSLRTSTEPHLEVLRALPELRRLHLEVPKGALRKLDMLTSLEKLTELRLDCPGCPLVELPDLGQFSELATLEMNLRKTQVTDLAALEGLHALTDLEINLMQTTISSLEPLSGLEQLERVHLKLMGSSVRSLTPLSAMTTLKHLELTAIERTDWTDLHQDILLAPSILHVDSSWTESHDDRAFRDEIEAVRASLPGTVVVVH